MRWSSDQFYGTTFFRIEEKQKLSAESLEVADVNNSLVTRYFIWSTGYNGFINHPLFGIGMYSFAYTSKFYNELPDNIYKKFVSGLTLHHGYYSMLVETGIFGFIGLLIFLVVIFRKARDVYIKAGNSPMFLQAFIAFWVLIYIITSLMFTDAWFWGRGIVMWGTVLGVISALNNIIKREQEVSL
ncbi:MAG: O-antigen ligase family protein [Ignavibacteriales bacterium]|nr:O-antigen ligase family protein [Ignavibacteriales bacterium]